MRIKQTTPTENDENNVFRNTVWRNYGLQTTPDNTVPHLTKKHTYIHLMEARLAAERLKGR